jgi:CheY-like chemotaxis protein
MNDKLDNKIKVFVVDDEEDTREYIKSHFKRRGYLMFTAGSAEEALPIIKEENPNIMLLDMNLPKMNGIELLKLVRQFNPTVKVILVSGSEMDPANDSQIKGLDVLEVVRKPVSFEALEEILKKASE